MSPFGVMPQCHRSLSLQNVTVRLLCKRAIAEVDVMRIRTATDLGAFIRECRTKLGMDQGALAEAAGTSRKWIIEVEQGKPRAEIGLLLRTLKTLGVSIDLQIDPSPAASTNSKTKAGDINGVLNALKKRP
jgi:HTH-type transcriptional regulator/antitoxin HipB